MLDFVFMFNLVDSLETRDFSIKKQAVGNKKDVVSDKTVAAVKKQDVPVIKRKDVPAIKGKEIPSIKRKEQAAPKKDSPTKSITTKPSTTSQKISINQVKTQVKSSNTHSTIFLRQTSTRPIPKKRETIAQVPFTPIPQPVKEPVKQIVSTPQVKYLPVYQKPTLPLDLPQAQSHQIQPQKTTQTTQTDFKDRKEIPDFNDISHISHTVGIQFSSPVKDASVQAISTDSSIIQVINSNPFKKVDDYPSIFKSQPLKTDDSIGDWIRTEVLNRVLKKDVNKQDDVIQDQALNDIVEDLIYDLVDFDGRVLLNDIRQVMVIENEKRIVKDAERHILQQRNIEKVVEKVVPAPLIDDSKLKLEYQEKLNEAKLEMEERKKKEIEFEAMKWRLQLAEDSQASLLKRIADDNLNQEARALELVKKRALEDEMKAEEERIRNRKRDALAELEALNARLALEKENANNEKSGAKAEAEKRQAVLEKLLTDVEECENYRDLLQKDLDRIEMLRNERDNLPQIQTENQVEQKPTIKEETTSSIDYSNLSLSQGEIITQMFRYFTL